MAMLFLLIMACAAFYGAISPLFRAPETISQERSEGDIRDAVDKSIRELRTDLQLQKIQEEDLKTIEAYLEQTSREA